MNMKSTRGYFDEGVASLRRPDAQMEQVMSSRKELDRLVQERHHKMRILREEQSRDPRMRPDHTQWAVDLPPGSYRPPDLHSPPPAAQEAQGMDLFRQQRLMEHSKELDRRAMRLRQMNLTRNYLAEERGRLRKMREDVLTRPISPPYPMEERGNRKPDRLEEQWEGIRQPPFATKAALAVVAANKEPQVEPVRDIIRQTRSKLPAAMRRYQEIRSKWDTKYEKMTKPYDGRLGPSSYEPWEKEGQDLCRRIVENEVERVLDRLFEPKMDDRASLDRQLWEVYKEKLALLIMEEIVLHVTGVESEKTACEYFYLQSLARNMADQSCVREAEVQATFKPTGRKQDDPLFQQVTDAFYASQNDRLRANPNVWVHTQTLAIKDPTEDERRAIEDEAAVLALPYGHLTPAQLKHIAPIASDQGQKRQQWIRRQALWSRELDYWRQITTTVTKSVIPRYANFITAFALSPNGRYFALATSKGFIFVFSVSGFNTAQFPIFRICSKPAFADDAIIHLTWSQNSTKLAGISKRGTLQMWFVTPRITGDRRSISAVLAGYVTAADYPGELMSLMMFDKKQNDFVFAEGPMKGQASLGDVDWLPKFVAFYPSFTLMGSSHVLGVGMSNNDFLRIDLEPDTPSSKRGSTQNNGTGAGANQATRQATPAAGGNGRQIDGVPPPEEAVVEEKKEVPSKPALRLGQRTCLKDVPVHRLSKDNTRVELFRGHRHPLVHFSFLEETGDIITVDDQGYIFQWRYLPEEIGKATYWYRPFFKYRISMKMDDFIEDENEDTLVRFYVAAEGMDDPAVLEAQRAKIEENFAKAEFRDPWRETIDEKADMITRIYRPIDETIAESGALFHEVTRDYGNNELIMYRMRLYRPVTIFVDTFLGCALRKGGRSLVCLLLYPPKPEIKRNAWVEAISVDLIKMEVEEPRIQIPLTDVDYKALLVQNALYINVCRPFSSTGAEYLFVNVLNNLHIYSLMTGQLVAKPQGPKKVPFPGVELNRVNVTMLADCEVTTTEVDGELCLLVHRKGGNWFSCIHFKDNNTLTDNESLHELLKTLKDFEQVPREERLGGDDLFLDPPDMPEAGARLIAYELMDRAIETVDGPSSAAVKQKHLQSYRKAAYEWMLDQREPELEAPRPQRTSDDDELLPDAALMF